MVKQIFLSKQTYLILGSFVAAGLKAILPQVSGNVAEVVSLLLSLWAIYNHQAVVGAVKAGQVRD